MAKKITQLDPLTTALDDTSLLEIALSQHSYRITIEQLRNKFISTDGTLVGNSDVVSPSEQAVKTYVDANLALQNEHNELLSIQGGDAAEGEYYHLTQTLHDLLGTRLSYDGTSFLSIDIQYIDNLHYVDFKNDLVSAPSWKTGRVYWDNDSNTFTVYNDVSDVALQVGQETHIRVRNVTGSTITNGQVVYVDGAQGSNPTISLSLADDHDKVCNVALATHDISNNGFGYVTIIGLVRGVDTSSFSEGDRLYVSYTTPGALQNTPPPVPYQKAFVGTCVVAGANGTILVKPTHHGGIDQLADVDTNGQPLYSLLHWDSTAWIATRDINIDSATVVNNVDIGGDLDVVGTVAFGNAASPVGVANLYINHNYDVSTPVYGININVENYANYSVPFTGVYGISATVQQTTSTSHNEITAGKFSSNLGSDSATVAEINSVSATSFVTGETNVVTTMRGGYFGAGFASSMGAATITNLMAAEFKALSDGSGAVDITNAYGVLISTPGFTPTGTLTNLFGLYIQDQSGIGSTKNYNMYSAGPAAMNYFEGDVHVGNYLDVNTIRPIDGTAVTVIGDISCNDLITAGSSIHLGTVVLSDHAGAIFVNGGIITPDTIKVGDQGAVQEGSLRLYGSDSVNGGIVYLHPGQGNDAVINTYSVRVYEDDLYLGPSTDTDSLTYFGGTGVWHFTAGTVHVGTQGTVNQGTLNLYGSDSVNGGDLSVYTGAGFTAPISNYAFQTYEDDLYIGPSTDSDALMYDGGLNKWVFTAQVQASTPTADSDVAIKSYVDGQVSSYVGELGLLSPQEIYNNSVVSLRGSAKIDVLDWEVKVSATRVHLGTQNTRGASTPLMNGKVMIASVDGASFVGEYAIVDSDGNIDSTSSNFSDLSVSTPRLATLMDGRVVFAYVRGTTGYYQIRDQEGNSLVGETDFTPGGLSEIYSTIDVTHLLDGGFAIVFKDSGDDPWIKFFNADGSTRTEGFEITLGGVNSGNGKAVTLPNGNVAVILETDSGSMWIFDREGNSVDSITGIDSISTPGGTVAANGNIFVIDSGPKFRIYDYNGNLIVGQTVVSGSSSYQGGVSLPNGDVLIYWAVSGTLRYAIYSSDGVLVKSETTVATRTAVLTNPHMTSVFSNGNVLLSFYDSSTPETMFVILQGSGMNIDGTIGADTLRLGGTDVDASATELNTKEFTVRLPDLDSTTEISIVSSVSGTVTSVYSSVEGDPGADVIISGNVNGGTDFTATLTIANGASQHEVDSMTPADNNTVTAGETIRFISDGSALNNVGAWLTVVITL